MILGQGNVALDVARILLTPPEHLEVSGQVQGWKGGVGVIPRRDCPCLQGLGLVPSAELSASASPWGQAGTF